MTHQLTRNAPETTAYQETLLDASHEHRVALAMAGVRFEDCEVTDDTN